MLLNVSCFKWYLGMNQLDSQCIHKYRLNGSLKFTAWAMILQQHSWDIKVRGGQESGYGGLASYPGPHAERGKGPGDTWQVFPVCTESAHYINDTFLIGYIQIHVAGSYQ